MRSLSTILLVFCLQASLIAQPCDNNTNSLSFSSASVNFTSDVNLAPDSFITVEAWIRATSWATTNFEGTILCKHSWSLGEQGYVLRAGNNGQANFTVCGKDQAGTSISWVTAISATGSMTLNTWYHLAGTYDGDSVRVYIDGIQKGAAALPDGMIQGLAFPIKIGRLSDQSQSQTRYFSGLIDEVRVWDRALSPSEILSKKGNHLDAGMETGLVGYWRFNEGTGTSIVDQTINGNNGTLASATWNSNIPFNQSTTAPVIIPNGTTMTSSITAVSYQWNWNGFPIGGANGQSWTATTNGTYTLTITDSAGCMATSGPYIITGVGIQEISADYIQVKNNISQLIISLKNGEKIKQVEIYNTSMQRIGKVDQANTEIIWEKGHLASGVYTISIINENKQRGVYRFVEM